MRRNVDFIPLTTEFLEALIYRKTFNLGLRYYNNEHWFCLAFYVSITFESSELSV